MRVYDPRDNQWKESTNPALMIAQFMMPEELPRTITFVFWLQGLNTSCATCARERPDDRFIGSSLDANGAISQAMRHGRDVHGVALSLRNAIPQPIADQIQIVMHVDRGIGPRREPVPINWQAVAVMADYCDEEVTSSPPAASPPPRS